MHTAATPVFSYFFTMWVTLLGPPNPVSQSAIIGISQASSMLEATLRNSVMVSMLASGKACVAEIPKLPAHIASKPLFSTNFADIASNAPPTFRMDLDSSSLRKMSDLLMIFFNFLPSYKKCPTFNYISCLKSFNHQ